MKGCYLSFTLVFLTSLSPVFGEEVIQFPEGYVNESPLPKGWPVPGPYGEVVEKTYPVSRLAKTKGRMSTPTFLRLFRHIKSKEIPLTTPVKMDMEEDGESLDMVGMAFLYQDTGVGSLGQDGKKVEVEDVKAMQVLSYAWQGARKDTQLILARKALEKMLKEKNLDSKGFRLLGYNSPGVSKAKRTHELQAILR